MNHIAVHPILNCGSGYSFAVVRHAEKHVLVGYKGPFDRNWV
ncbi:MAG TPA: hypothetical protein VK457_22190 [Chloroflexota bacterium]|nr:hypothetical protein [Chloroflexota bacterium]